MKRTKRSDKNGLKSTVPWSLYHYEIPRPQKNFHLRESSVNPGDNSGVEFRSDARLWDPATLGRLALSLHFLAGMPLTVWHPHQP